MLPKSRRLKKEEVGRVLKTGRRFSSKYFFITATGQDVKHSGFSVVVGKKVAANATLRNKLRRRVYNAIRPLLPNIKKQVVGVIVVKKGIEKEKFAEISSDVKSLLITMGVI